MPATLDGALFSAQNFPRADSPRPAAALVDFAVRRPGDSPGQTFFLEPGRGRIKLKKNCHDN
jgi:hypothetical protein